MGQMARERILLEVLKTQICIDLVIGGWMAPRCAADNAAQEKSSPKLTLSFSLICHLFRTTRMKQCQKYLCLSTVDESVIFSFSLSPKC